MVAPARSSSTANAGASARSSCPLCGGAVHPIASRCKHCRQDILEHRHRQGQGLAPLPPLTSPFAGVPGAGAVEMPAVAALVERERRRGWMRSWAFWVILLALGAMLASLVLLLWPQFDQGRRRSAPPANDRMNTDALPERGGSAADPWTAPRAPAATPTEPDEPAAHVTPPAPSKEPSMDPSTDDAAGDDDLAGEPELPMLEEDDAASAPDDPLRINPYAGGTAAPPSPGQPADLYASFLSELVGNLCARARQCNTTAPGVCTAALPSLPSRGWRCYTPTVAASCLRAVRQLPCDAVVFTSVLRVSACYRILMC